MATDLFYDRVSLSLHCNAYPAVDSSSNALVATSSGSGVSASSTQSVFGGYSLLFTGTSVFHYGSSTRAQFQFGYDDLSIEFRVYQTERASDRWIIDVGKLGDYGQRGYGFVLGISSTGKLQIFQNGAIRHKSAQTISLNTWTKVEICRVNGVFRYYINNVLDATLTTISVDLNLGGLVVGGLVDGGGSGSFIGFLDDIRVTKGLARRGVADTSPFADSLGTPPSPLPQDLYFDSVVFLCKMDTAAPIDSSKYNHPLVLGSGASIDTSVFKLGTSDLKMVTGASTTKGGVYTFSGNPVFVLDGDFTVEGYAREDVGAAIPTLVNVGVYPTGLVIRSDVLMNATQPLVSGVRGGTPRGVYFHWAVTRSGSTCRLFTSGVLIYTWTNSSVINASGDNIQIGKSLHSAGEYYIGHIDEVRVTKGIARYVAEFEAPMQGFADYVCSATITIVDNIVPSVFNLTAYSLVTKTPVGSATGDSITPISIKLKTRDAVFIVGVPEQGQAWKPLTIYPAGSFVFPTTPESIPYYYTNTVSVTSSPTEPTWNTTVCADGGNSTAWSMVSMLVAPVSIGPLVGTS